MDKPGTTKRISATPAPEAPATRITWELRSSAYRAARSAFCLTFFRVTYSSTRCCSVPSTSPEAGHLSAILVLKGSITLVLRGAVALPHPPGKAPPPPGQRVQPPRTPRTAPGQHPERVPRCCMPRFCSKRIPLPGAGWLVGLRSAPADLTPSKSKGSEVSKHYSPTHQPPKNKVKIKIKVKVKSKKVKTIRRRASSKRCGLNNAVVQEQQNSAG
jgi:hypothetical protein